MNCTICNKPIVLVPSAKERAVKFGGKPSDYVKLFTSHTTCFLAKRKRETSEFCQKKLSKCLPGLEHAVKL